MKRLLKISIIGVGVLFCLILLYNWTQKITTPEPLTEEKIQEELLTYVTRQAKVKEDATIAFGEFISRETERKIDSIEFTIVLEERFGYRINYPNPLETAIQTVIKYKGTFTYIDDKWVLDTVDKIADESCRPLTGVAAEQFAAQQGVEYVNQETDLQQGVDKVIVNQTINTYLVKQKGVLNCNFKFNKESKLWEQLDVVKQADWKIEYNILGRWEITKTIAERKRIYLDIESITEDGVLTATYKYINDVDISDSEYINWVGKAQADNPFKFSSDEDNITLLIPDYGKTDKIVFEGETFKR